MKRRSSIFLRLAKIQFFFNFYFYFFSFSIGIHIEQEHLQILSCMHRHSGDREYVDFYVRCHQYQGEIRNMEPAKCAEVAFFPVKALPELTIPYVRVGIENALAGRPFQEYP